MAREGLPALLAVAIERRYLDEVTADKIAAEARRTGKGPEAVLADRGLLSARRIERLQLHVRYKSLRKADKAYAKVALKGGLVDEAAIEAALDAQRRRFEEKRDCMRLGAIFLKQGKLTDEQDRLVRSRVAKISASESGSTGSAAATLMDDSASQGEKKTDKKEPSYELIDEAVSRVEAVRKAAEDLSESVPQQGGPVGRDSAAEFEAACVMLARRRVTGTPPIKSSAKSSTKSGSTKSVSKSTGALRIGA